MILKFVCKVRFNEKLKNYFSNIILINMKKPKNHRFEKTK